MIPDGAVPALLVAVGGALGAAGRFLVGQRLPSRRATALVNVLGSLVLGAVGGAVSAGYPTTLALLAGTGFCGAFTTYSTFAVELHDLLASRRWRTLVLFGVGTLVAALAGAALGRLLVVGP
ncbi:fluoride efflux transporter FluC [Halorarum halobium]|uniref:fluoride efflux transporter FluC n=1 Tax=Halorarum halobium TaxID=3075121 RepID=UPI0028A6BA2E|nr:CrcB family protein [Halobaculum sp. XH14]